MIQTITPYNTPENKKKQVKDMFNSIAGKYDFLNHFLSFGIDRYWRKKLINKVKKHRHAIILDIATGTGDLAIAASKLNPEKIIGIDLSEQMLKVGDEKIRKLKLDGIVALKSGDAEDLPFDDKYFDVVMVAFGIRNFENLEKGLKEINRVLKKGGFFIVLEFSRPVHFPVKQLYNLYSKYLLPWIGKFVSGDSRAYTYLPESVKAFPEGKQMVEILKKSNFIDIEYKPLTFRIASLYSGIKL